MQDSANYQELSERFGFAPKSDGELRLTELVARQESDLDAIARTIEQDPGLRQRLLRVANPGVRNEADYSIETVDQALMHIGMGCALVLAMSSPLASALVKTFDVMLSLKLEPIEPGAIPRLEGQQLVGVIGFSGKAVGNVYLRMTLPTARSVAAAILGLPTEAKCDTSEIKDAAGELLNIMTGNFKSNLCDAGLDCRIQPPHVQLTESFVAPRVRRGAVEHLALRAGKLVLYVDVSANPWNQG